MDTISDQSENSPKAASVMQVCPFCGAISEKSDGPCVRCKMENTALTRQATRARVGPWYVMQSRNPSAPGMKFSTLLSLIKKGQVTGKSVVRGPTTFQLWRFAARVKGISREFGACYACGAEIQKTSTFCPRCSRSQELPPNPDVLLENESHGAKAVYREVQGNGKSVPPNPPRDAEPKLIAPEKENGRKLNRPSSPTSAVETMAELAESPSAESAGGDLQGRPRQRAQEGVLTPRELAAAFSLQVDPNIDEPGGRHRRPGGRRMLLAGILLAIMGVGAAAIYLVNPWRERVVSWMQEGYQPTPPATDAANSGTQRAAPITPPDWAMAPPSDASGADANSKSSAPAPSRAPAPTPVQPTIPMGSGPEPAVSDSGTSAAAAVAAKLRQSAGTDLDTLAMQLRIDGMEAESRQDFSAAEYFYHQVELLPRDHWPGDIEQLLSNVERKKTQASDMH